MSEHHEWTDVSWSPVSGCVTLNDDRTREAKLIDIRKDRDRKSSAMLIGDAFILYDAKDTPINAPAEICKECRGAGRPVDPLFGELVPDEICETCQGAGRIAADIDRLLEACGFTSKPGTKQVTYE